MYIQNYDFITKNTGNNYASNLKTSFQKTAQASAGISKLAATASSSEEAQAHAGCYYSKTQFYCATTAKLPKAGNPMEVYYSIKTNGDNDRKGLWIDSPHLLVWVDKTFNTSTESTTYSIKTDSIYK